MRPSRAPLPPRCRAHGFTLIELMITVAVIAILSAVALPSYREHIVRSQLVDGTNGLSAARANMERHFQDNRTYASSGTFLNPCDGSLPLAQRTYGNFVISCSGTLDAANFTLAATGSGPVNGFVFTISQADVRATTTAPSGYNTCATAWLTKKGQLCS